MRWFRRLEGYYPVAANNAILAATPGHPLLDELVARMLALPSAERRVRYALGTRLLQLALADGRGHGITLHEPEVFYPLGPELSEHWFRIDTGARLSSVIGPKTSVVHWYASVRARSHVPSIDPDFVRRNAARQLLSGACELFPEWAGASGQEETTVMDAGLPIWLRDVERSRLLLRSLLRNFPELSVGGAVALSSLTTILGYGSLLFADNRALRSFGKLAIVGEIASLGAALLVVPAAIALRRRVSAPP